MVKIAGANGLSDKHMSRISKPNIRLIITIEVLIVSIVVVILALFSQVEVAKSVVVGFVCFCLPTSFFILRAWRYSGAKYARQMTQSLYVAEVGKFVLTFVCFAVSFIALKSLSAAVIFISYLAFFAVHQALLFWLFRQRR